MCAHMRHAHNIFTFSSDILIAGLSGKDKDKTEGIRHGRAFSKLRQEISEGRSPCFPFPTFCSSNSMYVTNAAGFSTFKWSASLFTILVLTLFEMVKAELR